MIKSQKSLERRKFLKGAAAGGIATIVARSGAIAAPPPTLAPASRMPALAVKATPRPTSKC